MSLRSVELKVALMTSGKACFDDWEEGRYIYFDEDGYLKEHHPEVEGDVIFSANEKELFSPKWHAFVPEDRTYEVEAKVYLTIICEGDQDPEDVATSIIQDICNSGNTDIEGYSDVRYKLHGSSNDDWQKSI